MLSARLKAVMTTTALLVTAVLAFAALAKFTGPNPKHVLLGPESFKLHPKGLLLDQVVASVEVLVIAGLLIFHRRRWAWSGISIMFAGFGGYALAYLLRGEPCGCFGNLWKPPEWVTPTIDVVFALAGLAIVIASRQKRAIVTATIIAMIAAYATGFVYAKQTMPPTSTKAIIEEVEKTGKRPEQTLLESPLLADVRADTASGMTYYIFIYDPDCTHCQAMLPVVQKSQQEYDETEDPVMRVRIISIPDIKAQIPIEDYVWAPTPTVLFVRNGELIMEGTEPRRANGEKSPFPAAVYDQAFAELNALIQSGGKK